MTDISHFYDEDDNIVRYDQLEVQEQLDAKEFINLIFMLPLGNHL